jgi:hypothetical protein
MSGDAMLLVRALRDPVTTQALGAQGWTALIAMARAEQLIGTLAHRLTEQSLPANVAAIMADARVNADYHRRSALWEAECAAHALADYPGKVILLKGTAYVAANLKAGNGRHIGDLDIMVAREDLPQVEALLLEKGGWEWVKEDAYDDAYYRDHMHELPPLIHKERDRMVDVHHTILPLTARPRPDAAAMLADTIQLENGLHILCPPDMVVHSAAHLFADGDLAGGLRNLWDIHCLLSEFATADFWPQLEQRAQHHQLWPAVHRAARLAHQLYGTDIPIDWVRPRPSDRIYLRRLTARDGWGRTTRKLTRLIFYIRSHWLRMPPLMLAQHLWTKWRKQK